MDENRNFTIKKYNKNSDLFNIKNLISDEGYFLTLPTKYEGNYIDGFFSVELERND